MMDDSLSDVQQEKKMSVEQLKLKTGTTVLEADKIDDTIRIQIACNELEFIYLDRNQAHMLMLYLQQHLGYVSISKDRLDE